MVDLIKERLRAFEEQHQAFKPGIPEKMLAAHLDLERDILAIVKRLSEDAEEKIRRREETIRRLREEVKYLRELAASQRTMMDENIAYIHHLQSGEKQS